MATKTSSTIVKTQVDWVDPEGELVCGMVLEGIVPPLPTVGLLMDFETQDGRSIAYEVLSIVWHVKLTYVPNTTITVTVRSRPDIGMLPPGVLHD